MVRVRGKANNGFCDLSRGVLGLGMGYARGGRRRAGEFALL